MDTNALMQLLMQNPTMLQAVGQYMPGTSPSQALVPQGPQPYQNQGAPQQQQQEENPFRAALKTHPDERSAEHWRVIEDAIAAPKEEAVRAERAWRARLKAEKASMKRQAQGAR